ncbi:MAG: MBL fold metallo-hydrolase, partial [Deltaproteobacteria bacterium]|nr:MBL fold metallo-hydrolase [Deltaproteobacteria bacterium]
PLNNEQQDQLAQLGVKSIQRAVITHAHGDHYMGLEAFLEKFGGKIGCTPKTHQRLEDTFKAEDFGNHFTARGEHDRVYENAGRSDEAGYRHYLSRAWSTHPGKHQRPDQMVSRSSTVAGKTGSGLPGGRVIDAL